MALPFATNILVRCTFQGRLNKKELLQAAALRHLCRKNTKCILKVQRTVIKE